MDSLELVIVSLLEPRSGFVKVEDGPRDGGPGSKLGGVEFIGNGSGTGGDEFLCGFGIGLVAFALAYEEIGKDSVLTFGWLAAEGDAECMSDAYTVVSIRLNEETFRKGSRGFDEYGIVKQDESLLGDVGTRSFGHAFLTTWGIERDHGGVGEAAADEGV